MRLENFRKILSLVLVFAMIAGIKCEYYTSVSGLEKLLTAENSYVTALEKHLQEVEKLYEHFQSLLDDLELERSMVQTNTSQYYKDPINTFKTFRRFVVDFKYLPDLTQQIQDLQIYRESSKIPDLPTVDDLKGAASGLTRLQRMYKLDSGNIAKGYLKGQKYSSEMSAYNCFVLGQSLYDLGEYAYASDWLIEAWHKLDEPANQAYPYVSPIHILEYLTPATYQAGNRKLAFDMNSQLLASDPENKYGLANLQLFESGIKENRRKLIINKPATESKLQSLYRQVCSGELQQTAQQKRLLRCRYVTNNVPYYLVGPMKMEELNKDPFVAHYYEVIYDSEIEQIIKAVEGAIVRSKVGGNSRSRFDTIRISKNSWLSFKSYRFLAKVSQRLEDITGLSIESGEHLQVANYGIGGHYGPHHDFINDFYKTFGNNGNRLLTALFYINDVELGGGTAFPALSIMVPPIKRSLLVWYNLHKSLEQDYRTWHAGCPVLKGSKWICNEWFHTLGQEFKRPCGLEADDGISEPYKHWT